MFLVIVDPQNLLFLVMNKNLFHILVVDDDDKIRDLVRQYLEENQFLVTTAKDAMDARRKMEIIKLSIRINSEPRLQKLIKED